MDNYIRVRSSVACLRCRRSKIKCDNSGRLDAPCENCTKAGQICEWPGPTPLPSKRSELPSASNREIESGPVKKKARKNGSSSRLVNARQPETIQLIQSIDRRLWDSIINTYERHFSTELSFLHTPTLKKKIYDLAMDEVIACADFSLVLLGLLALTARYHPELDKYARFEYQEGAVCGTTRPDRVTMTEAPCASEFFAKSLGSILGSISTGFSVGSVERVQALLMLGLYEWISPAHEGLRTWMLVGAASRMAQALKLGYEQRLPVPELGGKTWTEEVILSREVRRRTMFSCFILDRLVSCGKERMPMFRSEDLHIQMPSEKVDFDLSLPVVTETLLQRRRSMNTGSSLSILGSFVQLVDIWGDISEYCNSGGRLREPEVPPWEQESKFCRLRCQLDNFCKDLATSKNFLTFTPSNYFRHESGSGTYVLLHMLLSLCQIMLHREWVPFIAIRCERPSGPLDEPTFPPQIVPPGFWDESANELFKATRNIVDLVQLCGDNLPHSPLVAFVVYTASFTEIYARCFPQMDSHNHLGYSDDSQTQNDDGSKRDNSLIKDNTKSFEALEKLAKYSGVALAFVARVREVNAYFTSMIDDHYQNREQPRSPTTHERAERLSIRLGGDTGGLEEWVERSDTMIGNSIILKTDQSPNDPIVETSRQRKDVRASRKRTGTQSQINVNESDNIASRTRSNTEEQSFRLLQADGEILCPTANSSYQPSVNPPGGAEHTSPEFHFDEMPNNIDSMLLPIGQSWDCLFLHDMYLGSVNMEADNHEQDIEDSRD